MIPVPFFPEQGFQDVQNITQPRVKNYTSSPCTAATDQNQTAYHLPLIQLDATCPYHIAMRLDISNDP